MTLFRFIDVHIHSSFSGRQYWNIKFHTDLVSKKPLHQTIYWIDVNHVNCYAVMENAHILTLHKIGFNQKHLWFRRTYARNVTWCKIYSLIQFTGMKTALCKIIEWLDDIHYRIQFIDKCWATSVKKKLGHYYMYSIPVDRWWARYIVFKSSNICFRNLNLHFPLKLLMKNDYTSYRIISVRKIL